MTPLRLLWRLGMMMAVIPAVALAQQPPPGPRPSGTCDVREFGARGDGKQLDSAAINAAIQACAGAGGGTVEFPPGTYLSGTIHILSNITLHLQAGATLLGSPDTRDYTAIDRSSEGRATALLLAVNASHVAITGQGVIDGNGRAFMETPRRPHPTGPFWDPRATRQGEKAMEGAALNREGPDAMAERPGVLALFLECRDIVIRDITVLDAPNWCLSAPSRTCASRDSAAAPLTPIRLPSSPGMETI